MNALLDEGYFGWLYSLIGSTATRNPARSHWELTKQLYTTPFIWSVPNDDNRCADGKELRFEYLDEAGIEDPDPIWMNMECSMLEMIIALSRRTAFESYGEADEWFWELLTNLDLRRFTDKHYKHGPVKEVDLILRRLNDRTYDKNGRGGLFPLNNPSDNQTRIEIWYQMALYVLESEHASQGH